MAKTSTSTPSLAPSTPMELLGQHAGVSVIDPATLLTRLWYFDGKFLRAEDFRTDQQYVRSLVALSNQAVGTGVVHGYDARLATSDTIAVEAGLALTPSGRVVFLPGDVTLSISTLIDRASGTHTPGDPGTAGSPSFKNCPPDTNLQAPDISISPRPLYVLTAAPVEALCGEEERFGKLCEDACATETDRSKAVEGVLFRVRPVNLTLPTSSSVPFDGSHFRSRVAHAYYETERRSPGSAISGAALKHAPVWCAGAPGVGGDEVALAILDRSGSVTSMLDMWTARRELMEGSPQRYWASRFAMRPLDVFLAQVLQFQCQLAGLGETGVVPRLEDPCADQRKTLAEVNHVLKAMTVPQKELDDDLIAGKIGATGVHEDAALLAGVTHDLSKELTDQLADLRDQITDALNGAGGGVNGSASGSILVDRGIVATPSGGYLPVNASADIEAQVRALFGPGVDLRFCGVRPDFIPEALQEAQHMDRISLTQGIDNPDDVEEVDILVPNGTVEERSSQSAAFAGKIRLLPVNRTDDKGLTTGSALTLQAVGREHQGDTWSWTAAAFAEAPHQLAVGTFINVLLAEFGPDKLRGVGGDDGPSIEEIHDAVTAAAATISRGGSADRITASTSATADNADSAEATRDATGEAGGESSDATIAETAEANIWDKLAITANSAHDEHIAMAGYFQRMKREGSLGLARGEQIISGSKGPVVETMPDRDIQADERRPFSLWLDVESGDVTTASPGQSRPIRGRITLYSRASIEPVVLDMDIAGTQHVIRKTPITVGGAVKGWHVETRLTGTSDMLVINGGTVQDNPEKALQNVGLIWKVTSGANGATVASVTVTRLSIPWFEAQFLDSGTPRRVEGSLDRAVGVNEKINERADSGAWARSERVGLAQSYTPVGELRLAETPGVLDAGADGRELAESVINVIAAEMLNHNRDQSFRTYAQTRMFGNLKPPSTSTIATNADWVMFHRRRNKVCSGATVVTMPNRKYRWYHAVVQDPKEVAAYSALAGRWAEIDSKGVDLAAMRLNVRVDDLGFVPVGDVEFPAERAQLVTPTAQVLSAFAAQPRGNSLAAGFVSDTGGGDGSQVALGRLNAVTAAISGGVDTSGMQSRVISALPPEFQTPGFEGAMFTVGLDKQKEQLECATIVRGSIAFFKAFLHGAEGQAIDEDLINTVGADIAKETGDTTFGVETATFAGTVLENKPELTQWMSGFGPGHLRYGYNPVTLGNLTAMNDWEHARLPVLRTLFNNVPAEGLPGEITWNGSCAAVFLVEIKASVGAG